MSVVARAGNGGRSHNGLVAAPVRTLARPAEPILRARGLSVQFGPIRALENVDVDVRRGEIVALAGENGAGKSTLVRCLAGDLAPTAGQVTLGDQRVDGNARGAARLGVAVVWQDLALCDNLDVAANLLLGRETRRMMFSATRMHARAAALLSELRIPLPDTTALVQNLSGGQRQLVAVARAMRDRPQLLILDEPTASLGVAESAQVEELAAALPRQGTTVMLVTHDVEQMFRLADRIVVLRHGRLVAEVDPEQSHPDEVAALLSGQPVDISARRQLNRLHSLADQLASAEPSSSLTLILSALGAALDNEQLSIHVRDGGLLRLAGSIGIPRRLSDAWQTVPLGATGGQVGRAAASGREVVSNDVETAAGWGRYRHEARLAGVRGAWSVPFTGASDVEGVITVFRRQAGGPSRDELNLVTVYAGYAASAIERDQLMGELTVRNRILETIREVLETLAGPAAVPDGLEVAVAALRIGLGADEVGLLTLGPDDDEPHCRAGAGRPTPELIGTARVVIRDHDDLGVRPYPVVGGKGWHLAVAFPAPGGMAALVARWQTDEAVPDHGALMEDAANSLRLALEREASERARQEAMALRTSQELQRQFLSSLSHELRTPLTAIRGYASSLLQPDVDWDGQSEQRFLNRISDESARLGRLVEDLLDFSAIDSGILRLQPDWCDLSLVLEAARACLSATAATNVDLRCAADLPVIWADHDRLEQVFVNLLDNAVRHNHPGTKVLVSAAPASAKEVEIDVVDDGEGVSEDALVGQPAGRGWRRGRSAGAGLGLSIARGIVSAHGGRLDIERIPSGTRCRVSLPVALGAPPSDVATDGSATP